MASGAPARRRIYSSAFCGGGNALPTGEILSPPITQNIVRIHHCNQQFDASAAAQSIVFGMFGIRAMANDEIHINPHPPSFSPWITLTEIKLRGREFDVLPADPKVGLLKR
jgi:hypothetical protein